jgi:DNA-binding NarL/FixJ family response regulator
VLVADDDDRARSLFAALLRQAEGVSSVLEVEDGAEAVRLVQEADVHLAVLDLNMPRVDGLEAASKIAALQPSMRVALHSSDQTRALFVSVRAELDYLCSTNSSSGLSSPGLSSKRVA